MTSFSSSTVRFAAVSFLALGLMASGSAHADDVAGDAARGQTLYTSRCGMCHSPTANKIGPLSDGVYGRKAGTAEGYSYSAGMKTSGLTWDQASLDKWLTNPSALVAGTKMSFRVADAKDRADVIAYLKTLAAKN